MSTSALTDTGTSLRERQKSATAQLILEAVSRCLKDTALTDLTFTRVATEANIAERTIYRHFPTKEALLDAWWKSHQVAIGQGAYPDTAEALIAAAPKVFPKFDEQAELIRGAVLSAQGNAIVMRANRERVSAFRRAVRDAVGDLPEREFTRLCAVIQALYSATGWLDMREVWGLSGEESGRAVSEAIAALLEHARRRSRRARSGGRK